MDIDDLIARIAARNPELQRDDAELSVKVIIEAISSALASGRRAEIRGFGSFVRVYKAPRTARIPRTGVVVPVPAKYVPGFKAGRELRKRVNHSDQPQSDGTDKD